MMRQQKNQEASSTLLSVCGGFFIPWLIKLPAMEKTIHLKLSREPSLNPQAADVALQGQDDRAEEFAFDLI